MIGTSVMKELKICIFRNAPGNSFQVHCWPWCICQSKAQISIQSQNSAFISNIAFELYQSRLVTINEKSVNGNDLENLRICDNRKNPISLEPNKLLVSNKKTLHEFYLKQVVKVALLSNVEKYGHYKHWEIFIEEKTLKFFQKIYQLEKTTLPNTPKFPKKDKWLFNNISI